MDDFCHGEAVWDTYLTWNSDWPQFTHCFQHTVIPWVTCGFLWLTSAFYPFYLSGRPTISLPLTILFVLKLFACTTLIFLRIVQLLNAAQNASTFDAEISDYLIHIVTYLLLLVVLALEKRKGVITSPVLFFFWLLSSLVNLIPFYSNIKLQEKEDDMVNFSVFNVVFALTVFSFLLSCVAERIPPGAFPTNGNVEVSSSVLSRITFWWTNRMLLESYKGVQEDKLVPLNPRDITANTLPMFQYHLNQENHRVSQRDREKLKHSGLDRPVSVSFTKQPSSENGNSPELQVLHGENAQPFSNEKTALLQNNEQKKKQYAEEQNAMKDRDKEEKGGGVSVFRVLVKTFWWQILSIHSIIFLQGAAIIANPLIMKAMIEFTETQTVPLWRGYFYAASMFVLSMTQSLSQNCCLFLTTCLAMRISGCLTSAVYRKSLRMTSEARGESTVGEIVNLMSVDARNIELFTTCSFWMWLSPGLLIVSIYLLYTTVGIAMLAGLAFMVVLFVVNTVLMNKMRIYQKIIMGIRDRRVKLINEVLNGIKILKLYAWEPSFEEKVTQIRNEELSVMLKSVFINSFLTFAWTAAIYWMTLFTFMTYVFVDDSHHLDASTSFVALSYFNAIRLGVNILPIMIRKGVKSVVSMRRIGNYLSTPELDATCMFRDIASGENAIMISNGTFSWSKTTGPVLKSINLEVKRGSVVGVVGQVGVGKSSLLSALLGEMDTLHGTVTINGSIAYVPQQAWIQNDSLKNNILFGRDCHAHRYSQVLHACALQPDLEMLPAGDMTEIGEKGINLSGGQKQRVSVARAVYSDADVILLDDPLSAVDSHVGKHMFNEVISDSGLLKGKTRILVTHGLQYLPRVDCIVVLSEGRISEIGTYQQLISHHGPFAQFLTNYLITHNEESDSEDEDEEVQNVKRDMLQRLVSVHSETEGETEDGATVDNLLRQLSKSSKSDEADHRPHHHRDHKEKRPHGHIDHKDHRDHNDHRDQKDQKDKKPDQADASKLMTEEEAESGRVDIGVYKELAKALGYRWSLLMLLLFYIYNMVALCANLWLSAWADDSQLSNLTALPPNSTERADRNKLFLGIYAAFGVAQTLFVVMYAIVMAFRHIHACRLMHKNMLNRLLRAPMSFFDTTPLGRIVNRFSQDMNMLDSEICVTLEVCVNKAQLLLASAVAISYTTPIFLAVFAPVFVIYYLVMKFYIGTSCQLRRLQSKKRSPIYSHFGETLTGSHVIRAYGAQQRFIGQSESRVDAMLKCTYNSNAASRWLGVQLDFLGSMLVLAAAIFTVVSRDTLSAGVVGLSLSYALEITGSLGFLVRWLTELETNIVAVERIAQYTTIDTEADWISFPRPRPDWPEKGQIRFENYCTRYRPGLDLVIHDLTCEIKAGEKVGIVGRTGAGKSSLTLALFRVIEAAGGRVLVDDVDVASLGLHDLRHQLNILPQDPVIFDGSLRMNLDPMAEHSDDQVWTALEQAHLKAHVQSLPQRLAHLCGEGGENLSVGQRQLLCLARALLRKTRILVLDEATAAVDMETDDLIQTTIRQAFADCTILTIAHRIHTVIDYDRILVLDKGRMVEFGSPSTLLQDSTTTFYSLAKDAGLV